MTSLADDFRQWILTRAAALSHVVEGCRVESPDDEHVRIITEKATANVNFYELDPGAPEIVELNIIPADDPEAATRTTWTRSSPSSAPRSARSRAMTSCWQSTPSTS
ncbi:MAG: hypothetical protein E7Z98_00220 [Olsenella sp.]|nr:hypothetical protein [Olsenella sp.]